ncbi:DUF6069 family protein [Sinomonas sp. ASV486]|uniref:DUF6069 family protein n=1 Tax=Sinomonas sp. ASV486 TaxID=3051170 RepID=UPI0027DCEA1D|nr:DUF6069 family protein [Sinomonas sp. ASV486]MDQ4491680.1 DUF6069 family protein [Sinomonas sp. ASV486]
MEASPTQETGSTQRRTRGGILSRPARSIGLIVLAAAGALAVWAIAVPGLGSPLTVSFGPGLDQTVTPAAVGATAAGAGLLAWGLLAVLTRASARKGRTVWKAVAVTAAVLSLAAPVTAGTAVDVKLALAFMHLVVAAVLITGLPRSAAPVENLQGPSPSPADER